MTEPPHIIRRLDLYRAALPLATPLAHSQVATGVLDELFLAVTLASGERGWFEARGNGAYGTGHDADEVIAAMADAAGLLLGSDAAYAGEIVLARTENRLAAALAEGAALDALARARYVPLWRFLGAEAAPRLPTHASVAFLTPEEAEARARQAVGAGFQRFKIRVGSQDLADDAARVGAVRRAAPDAALVLDANGGWTADEAIARVAALATAGIAWLEQPTAPGDDAALRAVRERTGVKVVADESVRTEDDVRRLIAGNAVDGVHLKLEKCGTVRELRRAAERAKRAGMLVEIGMMDQGRLGSATIAAIASTVPADAYELWGFERVREDVAGGIEIEGGVVRLSERPGNGMTVALPESALVARWS